MNRSVGWILQTAKSRLRKRGGWIQNRLGDTRGDGPVCAIGAVISVCDLNRIPFKDRDRALKLLEHCLPEDAPLVHGFDWAGRPAMLKSVSYYNDEPDRKKKDILALFDCAIGKADG